MAEKRNKVVKYHKPLQINMGMIIFAVIFIYVTACVVKYFTSVHVSAYEVTSGTISTNNSYRGLILRDEEVVKADKSGYVNYYMKDSSKVGCQTLVYSVDETGDFYHQISEAAKGDSLYNSENLQEIQDVISEYASAYSNEQYSDTYNFKYDLSATLLEEISSNTLSELEGYDSASDSVSTFHTYNATIPGVVEYYIDGFEDVTIDNFEEDMFDEHSYSKTNLKLNEKITSGSPAYKLITSENWSVVVDVDDSVVEDLQEESVVQVKFVEDDVYAWANVEVRQQSDHNYVVLTFNNSMIRYAGKRFIDVELQLADITGLKIPNTSIVEKNFTLVPASYLTTEEETGASGFNKEVSLKDGTTTSEFVETTIYAQIEKYCYIDSEDINQGDVLLDPGSTDRYTVNDSATLKGVYNINKGYAVFKQINILYQNEEYAIVETGTSYGLTNYDHIALDGSIISEDQVIY